MGNPYPGNPDMAKHGLWVGIFERLDFEDFCPCMPQKFLGREKIWGILFSSLTGQGNDFFQP